MQCCKYKDKYGEADVSQSPESKLEKEGNFGGNL